MEGRADGALVRAGRRLKVPAAALIALVAALTVLAPDASAHGLVRRADLPIPEWLFAWAATGVLVVSFVALAVAWPRPRLERVAWKALPDGVGRLLSSRAMTVLAGAIGIGLLLLVVVTGYAGSQEPTENFAPTFVLITFWVGLAFASVLLGDVFRALNPWRALGRLAARTLRSASRNRRTAARRPYPEQLGYWPAAMGLLCFTWVELASNWGDHPDRLATAVVAYTILTLAAMAVYGVDRWSERGEAFSVYYGLLARMSVFEVRERRLGLRPPVAGLAGFTPRAGTAALLAVMIGSVSFDGLSQGATWQSVAVVLNEAMLAAGLAIESAIVVSSTLGLLACVVLVAGFYRLGVAGVRSVAAGRMTAAHEPAQTPARTRSMAHIPSGGSGRVFAHALVPIAFAYVVAHYLTYLIFEGQAIGYLASDPLGRGWDLFGSASAAIDFSLISQTTAWYLQATAVVVGHVAGLALAHDRALVVMPDPKAAVRSQYWLLAVMVGFTTLALWLLAESGS